MELKLFAAGLEADLECCELENNPFSQEYLKLSALSALSKWKKLAARVEFEEGERIIFDLLLSLKEDILRLENALSADRELLPLKQRAVIRALNFEHFDFAEGVLERDKIYYLRAGLNHQILALFIRAESENLARIVKIKPEDRAVFDAFVVAVQRENIINSRGK